MDDEGMLQGKVEAISLRISTLQNHLKPVLEKPLKEIIQDLSPLDASKVLISISYCLETLLCLHMRMGSSVEGQHQIYKDLDRVKLYMEKIKKADESDQNKRQIKVNTEAASRFIRNATWMPPTNTDGEKVSNDVTNDQDQMDYVTDLIEKE